MLFRSASVTTTGQLEESVDVTLDQDKIDALNKKIQKKIDEQFMILLCSVSNSYLS